MTGNTDPNPIIDEGAPISTGGITNAARLCDLMGINYCVKPRTKIYYQGCGHDCAQPMPVTCRWTLQALDKNSESVEIDFDLTDRNPPHPSHIRFKVRQHV